MGAALVDDQGTDGGRLDKAVDNRRRCMVFCGHHADANHCHEPATALPDPLRRIGQRLFLQVTRPGNPVRIMCCNIRNTFLRVSPPFPVCHRFVPGLLRLRSGRRA
ncbi:hypothetical protein [Plasticicumulans sp.]|uniref:hypothetical protein n=1 Tax=Plasticicumulans sp. TaxID=2307179 RepID=UPI000FAAE491|nr:hypothetical protein [Plasticicumulans sp.]MBS0602841.1 hypothetical protein [Pseudomonadota bacterium]RTK96736.1 MAG: hypothetical protein EKK65_13580 [Xanthomonadales bacterium]HMV40162.1 hypothetical protein [Plasticicumulans sp.]HMW28196.1 hypothetical protein [Plasticicumulans sp.]HMW43305.1 hypothetical protein [Plasticicumulans sp.]